jgi:hypothetical protein
MKLNLGSGTELLEDYINIDLKTGQKAYPLGYEDGTIDEIRASHLLEHFSHRDVFNVLCHWVSKLKEGGILKIAVPDFSKIVKLYGDRSDGKFPYYLMGEQEDENDFHKSIFDSETLKQLLEASGLSGIKEWKSEMQDCASLPVSLNLMGVKKTKVKRKIFAVCSMPRLMFTDNMTCIVKHLAARGIEFARSSGVFWGQCMTRLLENYSSGDIDYIITLDYDSWFYYEDVIRLCQLLEENPEYDAVMPVQIKRENESPMVGIKTNNTVNGLIPLSYFDNKDIVTAQTGHFGLTVFRRSCFEKLKKPWFLPKPDPNGSWNEGRVDEDIYFWHNFEDSGCKLGLSTGVRIGHLELMITYPDKLENGWKPIHMRVSELEQGNKPEILK